jgi:hypothetical protein
VNIVVAGIVMKVVLVNPPRSCDDLEEIAPPLGLLRLAAVADELGAIVYVEDYNLLWHLDPALRANFYEAAVQRLSALDADIYGFTSMAVDSHVAIELGRRLKAERSQSIVVVGGSHFSSIAATVRDAFPWIDHVVEGEGEQKFGELLQSHFGGGKPLMTMESVPAPLYGVVWLEAYFHLNPRRMANIEAGRGCRFKCSFCYSPTHYRTVRDFSNREVIGELERAYALGFKHMWFVEDNFLNHPDRAIQLCREIRDANIGVTWSCYATFPQLSFDVVDEMAAAGCTEVFSGIDAVGTASERAFKKAFLRGKTSLEVRLRYLKDAGITPTCAFLLSPPSHSAGRDFDQTISTAIEARCAGAEVLLNPLCLYTKTGAHETFSPRFQADSLQARLMMDLPAVVANNPWADVHPELFPFHSRYVDEAEWHEFLSICHCLSTLVQTYALTLRAIEDSARFRPSHLAHTVLESYNGWELLSGRQRRQVEQDVGFFVLESAASGTSAAAVLGQERGSKLSVSGL